MDSYVVQCLVLMIFTSLVCATPGCQCPKNKFECHCFADAVNIEKGWNHKVHLNLTYLPHKHGIHMTMKFEKAGDIVDDITAEKEIVLYKEVPHLQKYGSICTGIPYLNPVRICIKFYKLHVDKTTNEFRGCVDIELVRIVELELGCFPEGDGLLNEVVEEGRILLDKVDQKVTDGWKFIQRKCTNLWKFITEKKLN